MPALANSSNANGSPAASRPENWTRNAGDPPLSAITRSGSTPASARYTAQHSRCPVRCRARTGAGNTGLTIDPAGAVTVTDRY
jgi:hypothetical protein